MNMKSKKPKGPTPSLISGSNGKPKVVDVEKKSHCARCGCEINAGDECFGIPKAGGFSSVKRHCRPCFQTILDQTQKDLDALKKL